MIALAADIGGTYSRLAWSGDDLDAAKTQVFENANFDSLEAVIDQALRMLGAAPRIERMVLAVPGPVRRDPIRLTNIDWQLSRAVLQRRYRVTRLTIVNDFQAAALGALDEPPETLKVLNPAVRDAGPAVVAGAGTGLGMAWAAHRQASGLPHATEGGHIDFAPNDRQQRDLLAFLADRHGHVSYERILSGNGLVDLYRFAGGAVEGAGAPSQITALARAHEEPAIEAISLFVRVFAGYAGNLALAFNPTGGIYLCGGLSAHLVDWFDPSVFVEAYAAKGRMRDVVLRIPVYLITRPDTGLAGARRIIDNDDRAET